MSLVKVDPDLGAGSHRGDDGSRNLSELDVPGVRCLPEDPERIILGAPVVRHDHSRSQTLSGGNAALELRPFHRTGPGTTNAIPDGPPPLFLRAQRGSRQDQPLASPFVSQGQIIRLGASCSELRTFTLRRGPLSTLWLRESISD